MDTTYSVTVTLSLLSFSYFVSHTNQSTRKNNENVISTQSIVSKVQFQFQAKLLLFFSLIQDLILIKTLNSPLTPLAPLNLITKTTTKNTKQIRNNNYFLDLTAQ